MKIKRFLVTNNKSIESSGWVEIEDMACLVGKNESGKTSLLQALSRLNPVDGQRSEFDYIEEYNGLAF